MSEQGNPSRVHSDELEGPDTANGQLSESENGSDVDWVKVHKSKSRQSKEDDPEGPCNEVSFGVEQLSLSESALAALKPAYDGLAAEQHELMKTCTTSMRQGEHQRAYLVLLEETIEKFVSFAMSYTGKTLDATATARLKEIQGHFIDDKTELLSQVARNEECVDRLQDHHYRVAKQQSWFMALLHRLVYGAAGSSDSMRSDSGGVVKTANPSLSRSHSDEQTPTAADNSCASESRIWESQSSSLDAPASKQTIEEDGSSETIQGPDSIWATTVWKILEDQTELEAGGVQVKDDG